ncbi:DUF4367 domain-containing protein [Caldifermentibacillus hisashii]
MKEQVEIESKLQKEKREPNEEESKRLHQITEMLQFYENEFALIEAQQLVSYLIAKPSYIPNGYKQVNESFYLAEKDMGEDPTVELEYSNGEASFSTSQQGIAQTNDLEYLWRNFEESESYSLHGFEFVYVKSEKMNATGMRVAVPEKGYKITLIADKLSKEEMEKILLSMVEK